MNRSSFIKSIVSLTGTAFVYGCRSTVEDIIDTSYSSPTLEGAKQWFNSSYLRGYASGLARTKVASVTRILDWTNKQELKSKEHDFIWVPINYEGNEQGVSLLMWKEGEEYVSKLAKYLSWSISEGFLFYRKPNGEYDGFLAQIAFDPLKNKPGIAIDPVHFTGMVINASWDEKILRSWRFLDGKMINHYDHEKTTNVGGRTSQCTTYYSQYSTVTGSSCGNNCIDVTYTLHYIPHTYCTSDFNTGSCTCYTGSGGYTPSSGSGYGGYNPPVPPGYSSTYPYNKYNVFHVPNSPDRAEFNNRLAAAATAMGILSTTTSLSLDTATSLVTTLGMEFQQVKLVSNFSTFGLGAIGVVAGGASFAIGIMKDGWQAEEDGYNLALLAIGAVGVVGGGWIAVGAGVVSIIVIGVQAWDQNH